VASERPDLDDVASEHLEGDIDARVVEGVAPALALDLALGETLARLGRHALGLGIETAELDLRRLGEQSPAELVELLDAILKALAVEGCRDADAKATRSALEQAGPVQRRIEPGVLLLAEAA